jgi:hypothetical protein
VAAEAKADVELKFCRTPKAVNVKSVTNAVKAIAPGARELRSLTRRWLGLLLL